MKPVNRLVGTSGKWLQLYEVESESRPVSYVVGIDAQNNFGCSCPAWIYHSPRKDCKHIKYVKYELAREFQMRVISSDEIESKPQLKKVLSRFAMVEI